MNSFGQVNISKRLVWQEQGSRAAKWALRFLLLLPRQRGAEGHFQGDRNGMERKEL